MLLGVVSRRVLAVVVPVVLSLLVERLSVQNPDGGVTLGLEMSFVDCSRCLFRFALAAGFLLG